MHFDFCKHLYSFIETFIKIEIYQNCYHAHVLIVIFQYEVIICRAPISCYQAVFCVCRLIYKGVLTCNYSLLLQNKSLLLTHLRSSV
jgi:hypothetical protein